MIHICFTIPVGDCSKCPAIVISDNSWLFPHYGIRILHFPIIVINILINVCFMNMDDFAKNLWLLSVCFWQHPICGYPPMISGYHATFGAHQHHNYITYDPTSLNTRLCSQLPHCLSTTMFEHFPRPICFTSIPLTFI